MVEFRGSHGTTATRVLSIMANGFKPGHGVHGVGVYFWRESPYFKELAIGWYRDENKRGSYNQDSDRRCAIIYGAIAIEDEKRFFDLTRPDNHDAILKIIRSRGLENELDNGKLIDEFVDFVQGRSGVQFQIVMTRVKSPNQANNYPWRSMGPPLAYIVKDATCIRIEDIEYLEN